MIFAHWNLKIGFHSPRCCTAWIFMATIFIGNEISERSWIVEHAFIQFHSLRIHEGERSKEEKSEMEVNQSQLKRSPFIMKFHKPNIEMPEMNMEYYIIMCVRCVSVTFCGNARYLVQNKHLLFHSLSRRRMGKNLIDFFFSSKSSRKIIWFLFVSLFAPGGWMMIMMINVTFLRRTRK